MLYFYFKQNYSHLKNGIEYLLTLFFQCIKFHVENLNFDANLSQLFMLFKDKEL